jgi:hypothetical protein
MTFNLDQLIADIKDLVNLTQPDEGDGKIKMLLRYTSKRLSKKYASLFHRTKTGLTSDSAGEFTIPDKKLYKILSIYAGNQELRPVDEQDFHRYSTNGAALGRPIVNVRQSAGEHTGTIYPAAAHTDIKVVYQIYGDEVQCIPEVDEELLVVGTAYRYILFDERSSNNAAAGRRDIERF